MKILVDADACPVKDTIEKIAGEYGLEVLMVSNPSHTISSDYSGTKVIVVDGGSQSSDLYISNHIKKGDIVVTQDYGLACIVLAKGAQSLHPNGSIYTDENIDGLLMQRYQNWKARKSGYRTVNPRKRTVADDQKFAINFRHLIDKGSN